MFDDDLGGGVITVVGEAEMYAAGCVELSGRTVEKKEGAPLVIVRDLDILPWDDRKARCLEKGLFGRKPCRERRVGIRTAEAVTLFLVCKEAVEKTGLPFASNTLETRNVNQIDADP